MRLSQFPFFLGLIMLSLWGLPAKADTADKIFSFLKEKGSTVGINPDGVEMARYLYKYPGNGAEIISRAAIQDYPFFGLVGAVKAAKGKNFPQIGTFTEAKCLVPITAIDAVFGKADQYIDNAGGKAKTEYVAGEAEQYAKDYAKAQSQQAKESLKEELAEEVPYFGDIELICHFAFRSDFQTEKDIQKLVTKKVQDARDIYAAFKKKEIVKGAKLLVKMGFDTEAACDAIDSALDSGGIGKIPGVSELSNGLCKGVAGTIINGAIDLAEDAVEEGLELVEEGACAVYDFFGGSCNNDVKKPPSGIDNAYAFCAPHGGLKSAASKTNAPDDYAVICNNEMACNAKPGKAPRCTTLAQAEKRREDLVNSAAAEFTTGLRSWSKTFHLQYVQGCPDTQCTGAMKIIQLGLTQKAKTMHKAEPAKPWWQIEMDLNSMAAKETAPIKAEAAQRVVTTNQDITNNASEGWEAIFIAKWSKECPDQACKDSVRVIAAEYSAEVKTFQMSNPDKSALEVQGIVGRKYAKIFSDFVSNAKKYALAEDASAAPEEQLGALGCKRFLGRDRQWLCEAQAGFEACRNRVKARQADLCMSQQFSFGNKTAIINVLRPMACVSGGPNGLVFTCQSDRGRAVCQRFRTGGNTAVICG